MLVTLHLSEFRLIRFLYYIGTDCNWLGVVTVFLDSVFLALNLKAPRQREGDRRETAQILRLRRQGQDLLHLERALGRVVCIGEVHVRRRAVLHGLDTNVIQVFLFVGGGGGVAGVGFVAGSAVGVGGVFWRIVISEVRTSIVDHLTDEVDILVAGVGFVVGEFVAVVAALSIWFQWFQRAVIICILRGHDCSQLAVFICLHHVIAHVLDLVAIAGAAMIQFFPVLRIDRQRGGFFCFTFIHQFL